MKKKIITCAGVSLVIILVLLSVNFLQSGTGSISKENIEKENEFKKSLDVVAQKERSIRGMHFRKGKILQIIREQC